jgi:hypothetical protein
MATEILTMGSANSGWNACIPENKEQGKCQMVRLDFQRMGGIENDLKFEINCTQKIHFEIHPQQMD